MRAGGAAGTARPTTKTKKQRRNSRWVGSIRNSKRAVSPDSYLSVCRDCPNFWHQTRMQKSSDILNERMKFAIRSNTDGDGKWAQRVSQKAPHGVHVSRFTFSIPVMITRRPI